MHTAILICHYNAPKWIKKKHIKTPDLIQDFVLIVFQNNAKTCESLGELEKAVETVACSSCSHSIYRSPKLSLVFL